MSDIKATSNVKDMLLNGASKEDLMKSLEREIAAAQKEIDEATAAAKEREKKANDAAAARKAMVLAIVDYLDYMGFIDKDIIDEDDIGEITKTVAEVEKDYLPLMLFTSKMKNIQGKKGAKNTSSNKSTSADDIIKEFLKSL